MTKPDSETRKRIAAIRKEMKEKGIRRISCFNGGLDAETYRLNAELYRLGAK